MRKTFYLLFCLLACAFGFSILLLATSSTRLPETRWLVLLYPVPLLILLSARFRTRPHLLSITFGLLIPLFLLADSRWSLIPPRTAERIGGRWPNNYAELRRRARPRAYWLLDFWVFQRRFDSRTWKAARPGGKWPIRLHMSDDLLERCPMRGLDQMRVRALLGEPQKSPVASGFVRCKTAARGPQTVDSYSLVFVNNVEHQLLVEYARGKFLCAHRGIIIHY